MPRTDQIVVDPELADVLSRHPELIHPMRPEHIAGLRALHADGPLRAGDDALGCDGAVVVDEVTLPGGDAGVELPAVQLRPASGATGVGVLYLHGGGTVSGDARTGLAQVLDWVVLAGVTVVSVGYRLAPEHPHPAPVEDCYAALSWLSTAELGVDRWVLAGTSAGGGLAAGTALLARDRGGPPLDALLLLEPMLDDRETTISSRLTGVPWDAISNRTAWTALLGDRRGGADVAAHAAPARATDLTGMPPTFLDVGSAEVYRDETIAFAQRLAGCGVPAELHVWAGAVHGFDVLAPHSRVARAARATRLDHVQRLVGPAAR